ncbi:MAG: hypothetical protein SFU98_01085 [Leptospiraceae bacterium]|nr:hypothetical protein [Leptospiraceae bacterium]
MKKFGGFIALVSLLTCALFCSSLSSEKTKVSKLPPCHSTSSEKTTDSCDCPFFKGKLTNDSLVDFTSPNFEKSFAFLSPIVPLFYNNPFSRDFTNHNFNSQLLTIRLQI